MFAAGASVMRPASGHPIVRMNATMIRTGAASAAGSPPPEIHAMIARRSEPPVVASWTASGRNPAARIATPPAPARSSERRRLPGPARATSASHRAAIGGARSPASQWACMAIMAPSAARSHHRALRRTHASRAPTSASALAAGMTFGFQRNVDDSTAVADVARTSAAARPATGPPIDRASHHVSPTATMPRTAMSATTIVGSEPPEIAAAGASR